MRRHLQSKTPDTQLERQIAATFRTWANEGRLLPTQSQQLTQIIYTQNKKPQIALFVPTFGMSLLVILFVCTFILPQSKQVPNDFFIPVVTSEEAVVYNADVVTPKAEFTTIVVPKTAPADTNIKTVNVVQQDIIGINCVNCIERAGQSYQIVQIISPDGSVTVQMGN